MNINAIHTRAVTAGAVSLTDLLDESLTELNEGSIVVITSKVVSLCENAVVPIEGTDREKLIKNEADFYLPNTLSQYGYHFSVKYNMLTSSAGIDESNGNGQYVLWPREPWKIASDLRGYLKERFSLRDVGVIISDSTCQPMRLGTVGVSIAHSGFKALRNYIGQPDIFNRPFDVSRSSVVNGLAASAVVVMGEGTEQTPIVVLSDLSFVEFADNSPTNQEIEELNISIEEDLFAPFLQAVKWQKGNGGNQ